MKGPIHSRLLDPMAWYASCDFPFMMNHKTAYTTDNSLPKRGGYFYFVGVLLIGAGTLSVLFSLFGFLQVKLAGAWGLLDPEEVANLFTGRGSDGWANFVAGYVSFHLASGWIFGALFILGGIFSIQRRARSFIWVSTVINLFNFPHGTTVALMAWHGLKSPHIPNPFGDER